MMRHGSLFSGIGGFDLAASWMGWENVFHCEKDAFCRRVLNFYWPKAVCYEDIRTFDATGYRGIIDVLTGGFPCQPFSTAGRRKGTGDDRYLWPEMLRIIGEVRPGWIIGENVLGLLNWGRGMVFEQVLTDLEAKGYEAWAHILPAAGVGAPHQRYRIWFVAHAGREFGNGWKGAKVGGVGEGASTKWEKAANVAGGLCPAGIIADANSDECQTGHPEHGQQGISAFADGGEADVPNADGDGRSEGGLYQGQSKATGQNIGQYHSRHGGNAWENFPAEPAVCAGNDGLPTRLDGITFSKWRDQSLKGAGNAIVPQVVLEIFKVIERMELLKRG